MMGGEISLEVKGKLRYWSSIHLLLAWADYHCESCHDVVPLVFHCSMGWVQKSFGEN